MTGKAKRIAFCLVALLALAVVPLIAQAAPPSQSEIDAIQNEINKCKEAKEDMRQGLARLARGDLGGAVAYVNAVGRVLTHGQNAVDMANEAYDTGVAGTAYYPWLTSAGVTGRGGDITIGNGAFDSPGWLASTIIHEGKHREQVNRSDAADPDYWTRCTKLWHETEIEAYEEELKRADDTGLTDDEKQVLKDRIEEHRQQLPPAPDASVEFVTWTINAVPVPPGTYTVPPGTIIDIEYKEHVSGEEGAVVTVHQYEELLFHYHGLYEWTWLHAVNAPGAVKFSPPAEITYQMTSVEGDDAPHCTEIMAPWCQEVLLDVEIVSKRVVCVNYTKTINWLGIPSPEEILFDVYGYDGDSFTLTANACVEVEGDENAENDCSGWSPELTIVYSLLPPVP